ncbi:hypothetical protein [Nocardia suismassiliense]|uniref:hypothetical protein n=1 Tax=Nocardia suismassiliense TaxID=2077092 RepID=UPI000D1DA32C|nr:hypothetical protein [Nocardia suismassiliense]
MPDIRLTPVTDASPAAWLGAALRFGGRLANGFAAYARILHPATDIATGAQVSRPPVAQPLGSGHRDRLDWILDLTGSGDWDAPEQGSLEHPQLDALIDVLARHTTTPDQCYVGVWEGWQWHNQSNRVSGAIEALNPGTLSREFRKQASFELLGRWYLLLRGPIHDAGRIGGHVTPRTLIMRSPNLLWPADRAWFVCTEIDDYETYVSGTRQLIDELDACAPLDVEILNTDHPGGGESEVFVG